MHRRALAPAKESPSCGFFPLAQSLPWTQPGLALGRVVHAGEHVWYILAEHRWCIFGERAWYIFGEHPWYILGEHRWYIYVRLLTACTAQIVKVQGGYDFMQCPEGHEFMEYYNK